MSYSCYEDAGFGGFSLLSQCVLSLHCLTEADIQRSVAGLVIKVGSAYRENYFLE